MTSEPFPTLPEYDNPFIERLPPILSEREVFTTLRDLPHHDEAERSLPSHLRVHCAMRLGRYFNPNERHIALERRIDLLIRQGYIGRNPKTTGYYLRLQNDHERVTQRSLEAEAVPMRTTASGFALLGVSGMGKTETVTRILSRYPEVIEHTEPGYVLQVPWIKLECPYGGSVKQLCLNFFDKMDELLGQNYRARHGAPRRSIDDVVVQMAAIANRHAVGLIVIDEIQHLLTGKRHAPDEMLNFLVTLVNRCSTPVMIIGTPLAKPLVQGAFRSARRASGIGSLQWDRMAPGKTWDHFVDRMWSYQWTREPSPLTDEIRAVLYDESQGIIDVVVKLYLLAQLRAISFSALRPRPEVIDGESLRRAAREHLSLLQPMIAALRDGRAEVIDSYPDLQSFRDEVAQTMTDFVVRTHHTLGGTATITEETHSSNQPDEDHDEKADTQIILALERSGLAPDIARIVVREARVKNPDCEGLDLLGEVMDLVRQRDQAAAKPVGKGSKRSRPNRTPPIADDLRAVSGPDGVGGYDALLAAGTIKPPAKETWIAGCPSFAAMSPS